jgi:hypothetical protein
MALMNHPISNKPLTLEAVKQRFEAWRSSRSSRRESIPQHLWQAATGLCREHSISCVSQQLRLSYVDLKKRIVVLLPEDYQTIKAGLDNRSGGQNTGVEHLEADSGMLGVQRAARPLALQLSEDILAFCDGQMAPLHLGYKQSIAVSRVRSQGRNSRVLPMRRRP